MSALLRAIELGVFDTGRGGRDAVSCRSPGTTALLRDMNRIIDLWQSATGDRVKDRPAQPARVPGLPVAAATTGSAGAARPPAARPRAARTSSRARGRQPDGVAQRHVLRVAVSRPSRRRRSYTAAGSPSRRNGSGSATPTSGGGCADTSAVPYRWVCSLDVTWPGNGEVRRGDRACSSARGTCSPPPTASTGPAMAPRRRRSTSRPGRNGRTDPIGRVKAVAYSVSSGAYLRA